VKKAHPSLQTLLNVFVNIEQSKIREYKYETSFKSNLLKNNELINKFIRNKKMQKKKLKEYSHLELLIKFTDKLSFKMISTKYPEPHKFFKT